jgi:hypothetical protein
VVRLGLIQSSAEVRFGTLEILLALPDDCGRMTSYPEVMRQSKHCRAEPKTGFPLP